MFFKFSSSVYLHRELWFTYLEFVCLVKIPLLHEPLIWAESGVCGCHALLWFVEGRRELREAVYCLVAWSETI